MPIDDIKPTDAIKPYIGKKQNQKGRSYKQGTGYFGDSPYPNSDDQAMGDVTSFMNIPQEELTPAVTDAVISLMEEIDHLREDVAMSHSLEHKLSRSVDNHMDLPVLTRHALMREISVMAVHVGQSNSASTFVYFQIKNIGQIKTDYGLLAAEAAIRETAEILNVHLRETDRIGTLGGDGFGIILALSDQKQSFEKVNSLARLVMQGPIIYDGRILDLDIAYGLHPIQPGQEALNIVHQADCDLRKQMLTR
ncbi:GGDEF domain-containing protein [Terasakiella sp. A23]|uniref:GGDEF domain-containing protein n=1 Tax=Terasakiella sp. FCG-A23 TaxID=3080561 RepID=UPI00295385FC|nr:GGDEF domain-containing protein [Terasakiella sp. A23]MDV7340392.1 GGDEF domain-containing protein [Terasakiella sp. A23]